jgi:hypothetical protein
MAPAASGRTAISVEQEAIAQWKKPRRARL